MASRTPRHDHAFAIVSHTLPGDTRPMVLLTCQTFLGCSKLLIEEQKRRRVLDPETGKSPYKLETPDEFRRRIQGDHYPHACCQAQAPQSTQPEGTPAQ